MPLEPIGEREQEDEDFVLCQRCDEEVDATSRYCPECGASLEPTLNAASAVLHRAGRTVRRQGREMAKNPLGFFISWGIYVFCFALGVRIFVGCVQGALD